VPTPSAPSCCSTCSPRSRRAGRRGGAWSPTLADATTYLEAVGHAVIAWIWLEQYLACGDRDEPFHRGKRQAARYFFRRELPRTGPQLDLLAALDRTTVEMDPAWF
jgi:hypothetical protein